MPANKTVPLSLIDLPEEIRRKVICPQLSPRELSIFARTSRKLASDAAFAILGQVVVNAEPLSYQQNDKTELAAIAILKKHPEWTFQRGMVTDHFGREIEGSPYSLFLGAGDTWARKQVHEEILSKITNGDAIAETQFRAQFPNCPWPLPSVITEEMLYDARNIKMVDDVKAQLLKVEGAIVVDLFTDGEPNNNTKTEVEKLRKIYEPKKGEILRTGLHFPLAIMKMILNTYDQRIWGDPSKYDYYSRAVVGLAEAASTTVHGQCIKHGSNLDMKKGPDRRDGLFCRNPKGIPKESAPLQTKLGRTMFVDPFDGYSCFLSSSRRGCFDWYNKNGCLSRGTMMGRFGHL